MDCQTLDIGAILERLPLRYPMLLIDRVLELRPNRSIRVLKNVTYNEPFFTGHFPSRPFLPGVILVEALVQAASLLWLLSDDARAASDAGRGLDFVGLDKARFRRPVLPGDQLLLSAHCERTSKPMRRFSTVAVVADHQVASAHVLLIEEATDARR
jgi:3-hydroxyacyl-[acyl-carrier-protein] dehydratase